MPDIPDTEGLREKTRRTKEMRDIPSQYPPQPGRKRKVMISHTNTPHGAPRDGEDDTRDGGLVLGPQLEARLQKWGYEVERDTVDAEKVLAKENLPFKTEPESSGVRNAEQIVAIGKETNRRARAAIEAGYLPIFLGGDHVRMIMGFQEMLDRYPDPENPGYSALRVVFIDAHPDILGDPGDKVGNAHGRTISTLMGIGPKDLMPLMEGHLKLNPKNIMYVGISKPDDDELKIMKDLGITCWDLDRMRRNPKGFRKALRRFLTIEKDGKRYAAPFHAELDPDVMGEWWNRGTPMRSEEGMTRDELYSIARDLSIEGDLTSIGTAEIAPNVDVSRTEQEQRELEMQKARTIQCVRGFIERTLGEGDPDYYKEYDPHAMTSRSVSRKKPWNKSWKLRALAWAGGIAAGIVGLLVGTQLSKPSRVSPDQTDRQVGSSSGEEYLQANRDRMYGFMKNDMRRQIETYGAAHGTEREYIEYVELLRKVWDAESLALENDRGHMMDYLLAELCDALGPQVGTEIYQRLVSQA